MVYGEEESVTITNQDETCQFIKLESRSEPQAEIQIQPAPLKCEIHDNNEKIAKSVENDCFHLTTSGNNGKIVKSEESDFFDLTTTGDEKKNDIIADQDDAIIILVFKYQHDPVPVSIMIENESPLTQLSSMKEVLLQKVGDEPCINDTFDLDVNGDKKVWFKVKVGNGEIVVTKSQFLKYTVKKLDKIVKNNSDPITINIVTKFD